MADSKLTRTRNWAGKDAKIFFIEGYKDYTENNLK